jgi:hypothetical protein
LLRCRITPRAEKKSFRSEPFGAAADENYFSSVVS